MEYDKPGCRLNIFHSAFTEKSTQNFNKEQKNMKLDTQVLTDVQCVKTYFQD